MDTGFETRDMDMDMEIKKIIIIKMTGYKTAMTQDRL